MAVSTNLFNMVETAAKEFLRDPKADQDALLASLERCGLSPQKAWSMFQFVPLAFIHVVMRDRGIEFQPGYMLWDQDADDRSYHLLVDEPLYNAAVEVAERWLAKGQAAKALVPVIRWSVEYGLIRKLAGSSGVTKGIVLAEPILLTDPAP